MMKIKITLLFLTFSLLTLAQEPVVDSDTLRKDALNVYMTSASNYIKNEIPFINYVRDIKEADLYIIQTYQSTGSGGGAYTYFLTGQNKYEGMNDTITVNFSPDDTDDSRRLKQMKALKMGLMRYVLKTPLASYFDIRFTQPLKETVSTDKWNSWVYRFSINANSSGQSTYNYSFLYGSISANRVTEKSKFESSFGMEFQRDKTTYEGTTYESTIKDKYAYLSYVKSINSHWSVGGGGQIGTSSYSNQDLTIEIMPGIEYDVFPYSESTRRILTFRYTPAIEINNYTEETIRFKTKETVAYHSLRGSLSIIQKWGSLSSSLTWKNYFFDWSYYSVRFYTSASIRIVKGLSFNIYGSIGSVHDQITLPSGGASLEDVLLRRKEQATVYSYSTSFGFSYTFGSIYNNVVNPRFN